MTPLTPPCKAACIALAAASLATTVGGTAAASAPQPVERVPHELVGTVTLPDRSPLVSGFPLRVEGADELDLERRLGGGDDSFAAEVLALIHDQYPDRLPDTTTLLIGNVHAGCFAPESIDVVRTASEIELIAWPSAEEDRVECVVALTTVAVVAVDSADVPPGAADGAELVAFEQLPPGREDRGGVELGGSADSFELSVLLGSDLGLPTLPSLGGDERRFVFVLSGCRHTAAELIVTRTTIDATLEVEPGTSTAVCAEAEWFLAVFDVPARPLPSTAVVVAA